MVYIGIEKLVGQSYRKDRQQRIRVFDRKTFWLDKSRRGMGGPWALTGWHQNVRRQTMGCWWCSHGHGGRRKYWTDSQNKV